MVSTSEDGIPQPEMSDISGMKSACNACFYLVSSVNLYDRTETHTVHHDTLCQSVREWDSEKGGGAAQLGEHIASSTKTNNIKNVQSVAQ